MLTTGNLVWLILFAPLLAAGTIMLCTRRLPRVSAALSIGAVVLGFALSLKLFVAVLQGQPVVAPLGNAMQTGDVVLRLAAALGDSVAKAFPWKDCREAVLARFAACSGNDGGAFGELNAKGVWKVGGDGGGGAHGRAEQAGGAAGGGVPLDELDAGGGAPAGELEGFLRACGG